MLEKKKPRSGRRKLQITIYPKTGQSSGKTTFKKKKVSSSNRGFLNRYEFAYAGRDVVNQVGKVAPKMISQTTGEINKIAQQIIDQVVRSGGTEIERVAPKIIRGAIEEVYKTPFRLQETISKNKKKTI